MSEVTLTIRDAQRAVHGHAHGSMAERVIAALSAEPETIEELEAAAARFIKPTDESGPFAAFRAGLCEEPWDAGIVVIDLVAQLVAAESTYFSPSPEGQVRYHDGSAATDVWISYRVPDDWMFIHNVESWQPLAEQRREERAALPPLDARAVLYGRVTEFIVKECLDARAASRQDPIADIHACWLMTPRAEFGMTCDSRRDRIIFFGGDASYWPGGSPGPAQNNDTWVYDYDRNTWANLNPSTRPPATGNCRLAYDSESDRIILVGSGTGTWAYDGSTNTWQQMQPTSTTPPSFGVGMTYDNLHDRVIVMTRNIQTWAYDFNTNTWQRRALTGLSPAMPARQVGRFPGWATTRRAVRSSTTTTTCRRGPMTGRLTNGLAWAQALAPARITTRWSTCRSSTASSSMGETRRTRRGSMTMMSASQDL